ncbi:hypothetical protein KAFR_0I01610 [Kazachstania africana CBS 2517]|uniref:CWH43-like N-terminal domain-containing protein n=1 Tax=Kazachstania africana (strain ATCC 22294 / BCRC 22015 / CBS 2517 / CECT 1963 / NBRC 1671 / NRRL Y-8276) TaxID=1071382 RepID=H2AZZ2_KAZAF|nr:hypothetical protein KAFR_0I01610 [Kazachstania africana CBS 2517]CCF59942.1 hypothetical protein KAFR_0I01610 [Kazachstania africana CBS 2517]
MFQKPGNYCFLVPWIAFIPWYGMLITMLICWAAQGHPIYWFMHTDQFPVYISDIGATNLRPLFIACSAWQGIGFVICLILEFLQRHFFWMNPWFTVDERNLIFAAIVFGCIGELGLLFCTIFSTALFHTVHTAMVCVFVIFMFLAGCCLAAEYFIMGRHYGFIHYKNGLPPGEYYDEKDIKWNVWKGHYWNKFTISACFKTFWLIAAVVWAIMFGALSDNSKSACFEWLLAFWLGIFFIIISVDFYLGSLWKKSKYWPLLQAYGGYYKFEQNQYKRMKKSSDDLQRKEVENV